MVTVAETEVTAVWMLVIAFFPGYPPCSEILIEESRRTNSSYSLYATQPK
jgi:hypothetical protein